MLQLLSQGCFVNIDCTNRIPYISVFTFSIFKNPVAHYVIISYITLIGDLVSPSAMHPVYFNANFIPLSQSGIEKPQKVRTYNYYTVVLPSRVSLQTQFFKAQNVTLSNTHCFKALQPGKPKKKKHNRDHMLNIVIKLMWSLPAHRGENV